MILYNVDIVILCAICGCKLDFMTKVHFFSDRPCLVTEEKLVTQVDIV